MSRILDHKKQYVCTEVFRLEELQKEIETLDDFVDEYECGDLPTSEWRMIKEAVKAANEFINNLTEQERQK